MTFAEKIERFRATVEAEQLAEMQRAYPALVSNDEGRASCCGTIAKPGRAYTRVDVGRSGKYMVDNATGEIFGVKAYGVIHRGHRFGTLNTVAEWWWGGYQAIRRQSTVTIPAVAQDGRGGFFTIPKPANVIDIFTQAEQEAVR